MPEHSAARQASADGSIENINLTKVNTEPAPYINCVTAMAGKQEFQYIRLYSIHTHIHMHTKFQHLVLFCARQNLGYLEILILFLL